MGSLEDGRHIRVIGDAANLDWEERKQLGNMEGPGSLFFKLPDRPGFLAKFTDPKLNEKNVTDAEVSKMMAPVFAKLDWTPQVTYEKIQELFANSKIEVTVSGQPKPVIKKAKKAAQLKSDEDHFIHDCSNPAHFWDRLSDIFQRIGVTSGSIQKRILEKLQSLQFINLIVIPGRYGKIVDIQPAGWSYLKQSPPKLRGKHGSIIAKFFLYKICSRLGLKPESCIEGRVGNKNVDILYRING